MATTQLESIESYMLLNKGGRAAEKQLLAATKKKSSSAREREKTQLVLKQLENVR